MKIICMIPARMGSKRVPKKNIRLLAGRPLISYALRSAQEAKVFDEIYLNSEDEIFREIAVEQGVLFYKRPEIFSTDQTNNDEFLKDFIENVEGDLIVQLLPTSPFILPNQIKEFVHTITKNIELDPTSKQSKLDLLSVLVAILQLSLEPLSTSDTVVLALPLESILMVTVCEITIGFSVS